MRNWRILRLRGQTLNVAAICSSVARNNCKNCTSAKIVTCDLSASRMQVTVRVPPLYSLKLRHSSMLTMFVYSTKERGIRGHQCFRRHRNIDRSIDLNGTKPALCGYLKHVFSIHILLRRVTIFLRVGSVPTLHLKTFEQLFWTTT